MLLYRYIIYTMSVHNMVQVIILLLRKIIETIFRYLEQLNQAEKDTHYNTMYIYRKA